MKLSERVGKILKNAGEAVYRAFNNFIEEPHEKIDHSCEARTHLFVSGKDFGPIQWVENNHAAGSHIIHCRNGDYEI